MSEVNNEMDKIVSVDINEEMKQCYIDYAMSVIVARALPDVRDGLKPVQRRILYSMSEMNLEPNKPYKKSARITGDTMGKYHPHGDSSIYAAMVRMAQNFSMRYMLVDGHGNFGSIDGYGAAAARYTEARMSKVSAAMLADIEKDTVDFVPNYDETEKEPVVLPARIPNLLINGSSGIAVGMATNIPPHNLGEVIDGLTVMIDNKINGKETDVEELMEYIKGPDFPTGATILGKSGIRAAYRTGRGKILVRSTAEIQPMGNGREKIVVTEIPYMVNKLRLIEKIAELVKEKRVDGISDLYDASAGDDIQIIIELKKDANANVILNQLYKYTQLQESFGAIMIALVNGKPAVLNLQQMLSEYLKHQEEVVTRRTKFNLDKAEKRAHILEGLRIAISNIDEVIRIIRTSYDNAKERLMERFGLSEIQAQAILEMRLYKLIGLEIEALMKEHDETLENIAKYEDILEHRSSMAKVIIKELTAFKKAYGKERKTVIDNLKEAVVAAKKIEEQDVVFLMDRFGYAKIVDTSVYERNKEAANAEYRHIFTCKNTDKICIFTDKGQMHLLKVLDLPYGKFRDKGTPIDNLCNYDSKEENVVYLAGLEHVSSHRMLFGTKYAMIKVVDGMEFVVAKKTTAATKLGEEDEVLTVCPLEENDTLVMATKKDMFLRIDCAQIPQKKKGAVGVRGMKLAAGDELKSIHVLHEGEEKEVEVKGKPVALHRLHVGNRDTKGVKK